MKSNTSSTRLWRLSLVMESLLLVCALGHHAVLAQPSPGDSLAVREARSDWLQADLTLDNSGYAATRKAIDTQVRSGVNPTVLVERYRLQDKDARNPGKIFRWAYAVYRQEKRKSRPEHNVLLGVSAVMDRNLRPGAYDWVRLRFLVASLTGFGQEDGLAPVGRRLLQQRYNDEEVTYHYIGALSRSDDEEDRRVALALAKQQARQYPQDVYWQWKISEATDLYLRYKGITYEENKRILAEMNKTLRMLPAGDPQRKRLIEAIVIYQMHYDANGNKRKHTTDEINRAIANTKLR